MVVQKGHMGEEGWKVGDEIKKSNSDEDKKSSQNQLSSWLGVSSSGIRLGLRHHSLIPTLAMELAG